MTAIKPKLNSTTILTSISNQSDNGSGHKYRPPPTDFAAFIPWACYEIGVVFNVEVTRTQFTEQLLSKKLSRPKTDITQTSLSDISMDQTEVSQRIHVIAVYTGDKLVQIKIENNTRIPRELYKIIALTLCFHPCLNSIVINQGLTMAGIHELRHCLQLSNITEIILDDTYVEAANYYILLEFPKGLRRLSLARCFIQDIGVEHIAAKLAFPQAASDSLAMLNLSTNRITDVGATYLATALRSNRSLNYLNLTNNMITDKGAKAIFDVMLSFPLSYSELIARNERYLKHLRKKHELIDKFITNVKSADSDKRKYIYINKKAQDAAKELVSDFKDPYQTDIFFKDGVLHCNGNNTLAYLNLSYNDLSYLTLKLILKVLEYQKYRATVPRGLVRVGIDGNPMPKECKELKEISYQLEIYIQNSQNKPSNAPTKSKSNK